MARLPLLLNKQRIKTLEDLRENFNLPELIERYHGGQLRAWLYNWDFEEELKAVENLPSEQNDEQLAENLCMIFQISDSSQKTAIDALKTAKEEKMLLEQRLVDALKQKELEKQRQDSTELTIENIEFSWTEVTLPGEPFFISSANDRLAGWVDIRKDNEIQHSLIYSYDGIHWEKVKSSRDLDSNYYDYQNSNLSFINNNYILAGDIIDGFYFSSDFQHWEFVDLHVPADSAAKSIKVVWDGEYYYCLCTGSKIFYYTKKLLFMDTTGEDRFFAPFIYKASDLKGPWLPVEIKDYRNGDTFDDICIFNGKFVVTGGRDSVYRDKCQYNDVRFIYSGSTLSDLERKTLEKSGILTTKLFCSPSKCFRFGKPEYGIIGTNAHYSMDGWNFGFLPYGISSICASEKFLVSAQYATKYDGTWFDKATGFHICFNESSKSGLIWYKLKTPVDDGNLCYFNDKVIIQNGNKLYIGNWKVKSNI